MQNYGGTFNAENGEQVSAGRITVWHDVTEIFPGGAHLAPSETYPVGNVFPAGTPIAVTTPGGTPTLDSATPTGLSKDERIMGSDGCTFTVVTKGTLYAKRVKATLTDAQKAYLKGQITFLNA